MSRTLRYGGGTVELGEDGCVVAITHPDGRRSMLLREADHQRVSDVERAMHEPSRRWGTGFVISDHGAVRWHTPDRISWHDEPAAVGGPEAAAGVEPGVEPDLGSGVELGYDLGKLSLDVTRSIGADWTENYRWRNTGADPLEIGSLAISTPWRDVYGSSRDCLREAVHAHVWTGGSDAWVWAEPMDGSRPALGLTLTAGALMAYSVESRDQLTGSNVRGHLMLHVTDQIRAPHAMGGQQLIRLGPGESYELGWRLRWYDDHADFVRDRAAVLDLEVVSTPLGVPIAFRSPSDDAAGRPGPWRASEAGLGHVEAERDGRRGRVALFAHPPLHDLVAARCRFVLERQRPREAAGSGAASFVPFDSATGLRVERGGWRDWNAARERIGTAIMLQEALVRDVVSAELATEARAALAEYETFVRDHLLTDEHDVLDDPADRRAENPRLRLYNFPWFAWFLLNAGDVEAAAAVLQRYYLHGGDHFLAFGLGPLLIRTAELLDGQGSTDQASGLRGLLLDHARTMVDHGDDLPAHEVNYEQSMVAPLLQLLIFAHRLDPDVVPAAELRRRLPWLTAFGSDQPDARVRHVPIRHWDGYWFGASRMWGDTFPHYWSVLSAEVFLDWPADAGGAELVAELQRRGEAILRSNLIAFDSEGRASCAFVYPSAVNARPAHVADPLANDQDWALVYALTLGLDAGASSAG